MSPIHPQTTEKVHSSCKKLLVRSTQKGRLSRYLAACVEPDSNITYLDIVVNALICVVLGVIVNALSVPVGEVLRSRDGAHDWASMVDLRHHHILLHADITI